MPKMEKTDSGQLKHHRKGGSTEGCRAKRGHKKYVAHIYYKVTQAIYSMK